MNVTLRIFGLLSALSLTTGTLGAQSFSSVLLPGSTATALSSGDQMVPAIAKGASNYLVVWEDTRAAAAGVSAPPNGLHANRDIYAARLDLNGNLIDTTPIIVNQDPFNQVTPRVAWNGENYLVVWQSSRATAFYVTAGIYAARVSPAGVVLDETPIVIEDGDDFDERDPVVASDGTNWAVFYNDYTTGEPTERLDGALVHPLGFVTLKRSVITGTSGGTQAVSPDVEFAVDRYLVAYERGYSGAFGRFVDVNLNPLGTQMTFHSSFNKPEVASNGASFFVAFGMTRGTPVALDGTIAVPGGGNYVGSGTFYSPATDCAWDGTNWLIGFRDIGFGSPLSSSLQVSLVSPAGALLPGMPIVLTSTSEAIREFALANGNGVGQVVWNDWTQSYPGGGIDLGDIVGAQTFASGGAGPIAPISVSAPAQVGPVIAGSPTAGYLVAYLSLTSGVTQVVAQRIAASGIALDPQPIVLETGGRVIQRVDVAFDGTEWLVVWNNSFGTLAHTFGRRVALDGTIVDPASINIVRGSRPSVDALVGQRSFLVASWDHNQSTEYIRAERVDGATGALPDAPYLTLPGGSGLPDVMGFDDRWIVVWGGVSGVFVQANGSVGAGVYMASGASESGHGLARSGDMGLLAFRTSTSTSLNADVHGRRFMKDGTLLETAAGFPICQAAITQFDPRATFDGTNFVVCWSDYRAFPALVPGIGDLYQAKVSTGGTTLALCGVGVSTDVRIPEGDAEIASTNGGTITAACILHAEAPYGTLRIDLRVSDLPPLGAVYCFGDGSGTACPCANHVPAGTQTGCAHSLGQGASLRAEGVASLVSDSVRLNGAQMPNSSALYFQGLTQQSGGAGTTFGDGKRCTSGGTIRLGTKTNIAGASRYPEIGDATISTRGSITLPGTRTYQVWYRNSAAFCTPATFNLSSGIEVSWGL